MLLRDAAERGRLPPFGLCCPREVMGNGVLHAGDDGTISCLDIGESVDSCSGGDDDGDINGDRDDVEVTPSVRSPSPK